MDWLAFFDQHRIEYVESGANVSRNQVVIHCVWCGADDRSHHLSVNLDGKGFRCWRNPHQHSGKNPARLIQALLKCSWEQANRLAGNEKTLPSDFLGKLRGTFVKEGKQDKKRLPLKLPKEFKSISDLPSARPYIEYLRDRRFTDNDIFVQTHEYKMYYATQGLYKGRIIFTVWQDGELVGWTGRTIHQTVKVRYSTLTDDLEKAEQRGEQPAPAPISSFLLFYDRLIKTSANTIVICEGPFDAWRVNLLGERKGICATAVFTSMLSHEQMNLLHALLPKFEYRYLLLDQNTFSKAARIRSDLAVLDVKSRRLPDRFKDPGELTRTSDLLESLKGNHNG